MTLRSGGLFAGYGGLDIAVSEVFAAEQAWFSEIEDAPSKILAHHWPGVPNHGDITQIDWDAVEPVDILSGGFPCQDVSSAGKRAGLHPDTRSGLWNHMAYAISKLRPRFVVAENVRGLLSAEADSDMEPCTWCLGDGPGEPALRALGAVLGDLAELGYDAQWCGLRAADVGAPHGRYRIFILAEHAAVQGLQGSSWRRVQYGESSEGRLATPDPDRDAVREQPVAESWGRRKAVAGLPGADAAEGRGTPTAWGQYAPAIEQWERILGRLVPAPTEPGARGGPRLSPRFVEWMQGLPAGHVTAVPGVNRNAQLKALGNGVVPQQAIAALRHMHSNHMATLEASA